MNKNCFLKMIITKIVVYQIWNLLEKVVFLEKTLVDHSLKTVRLSSLYEEGYYWLCDVLKSNEKIWAKIKDIAPFGSTVQFTHNKNSDLDIALVSFSDNDDLLMDIRDYLCQKQHEKKEHQNQQQF